MENTGEKKMIWSNEKENLQHLQIKSEIKKTNGILE